MDTEQDLSEEQRIMRMMRKTLSFIARDTAPRDGNASPLAILACIRVFTLSTLPVPLLSPIDRSGTDISPGMTLIVHPNTYHPEVGYLVLGDVVVVTATGCEVLTQTPRVLFQTG